MIRKFTTKINSKKRKITIFFQQFHKKINKHSLKNRKNNKTTTKKTLKKCYFFFLNFFSSTEKNRKEKQIMLICLSEKRLYSLHNRTSCNKINFIKWNFSSHIKSLLVTNSNFEENVLFYSSIINLNN